MCLSVSAVLVYESAFVSSIVENENDEKRDTFDGSFDGINEWIQNVDRSTSGSSPISQPKVAACYSCIAESANRAVTFENDH
mmetsp:Transcript_13574/g.24579  ORF Transcript_13574/g.24579 Transcript_13574/m.24579 type:complete len:82 (+) Transcript_13574:212-457(+)